MISAHLNVPCVVTGLLKTKTEMKAARTPLAFPSTCNVRGEVNLVTKKLRSNKRGDHVKGSSCAPR